MLEALGADGPPPEFADKLRTFGQSVGAWDLECTEYELDGTSATETGEWHFTPDSFHGATTSASPTAPGESSGSFE